MGIPNEKDSLPSSTQKAPGRNEKRRPAKLISSLLLTYFILRYCLLPIWIPSLRIIHITHHHHHERRSACAQAEPIHPQSFDVNALIEGKKGECVEWLSGAEKVRTEIFDVMGEVGEDSRWEAFYPFADCEWTERICY